MDVSINPAKQDVAGHCSAATAANRLVPRTAHPVKRSARMNAFTANVKISVARDVYPVRRNVLGNANIMSVASCVASRVTDPDVNTLARRNWGNVVIPVLVCAASPARRNAGFATRKKSLQFYLVTKMNPMPDL